MENEIQEIIKAWGIDLVGIADPGRPFHHRFPAGTPKKNHCGSSRLCVDACPAGAITGEAFIEEEPRQHIYDPRLCNEYMRERRLSLLGKHVFGGNCGLCVQVCPFGKPRKEMHLPLNTEEFNSSIRHCYDLGLQ